MTHDNDDQIVNIAFKAPKRMVDAINKAASRRLLNRASYVRMATLAALEDDGEPMRQTCNSI